MLTDFTWIRHGETAENLAGIVQGHLDRPLDDLGLKQARCAAERLRDEHFDHIFTSDLIRARQTADIIAETLNMTAEPLQELREWHLGRLEGHTRDEIMARWPEVMKAFIYEPADVDVPGGETHRNFFRRVAQCLDRLAEQYAGQRLLLVTHGGTLRAIYHHIAGPVAPDCMLPVTSNAAYGRFYRHDRFWQMACWNDVSHLKSVGLRNSLIF